MVRLLANEADLERLQMALPDAQYAALYALSCGMTVDEAWAEVARLFPAGTPPEQVDQGDLVAAMERSPDQVAFVSGPQELPLILAHPFAAWRTFLHSSQREIAYKPSYAGPAQVTGGPGTGKTVTVLHRAAFLAARAATSPEAAQPVLVTTFNGNLAEALHAQLGLLIRDAAVHSRIEVLNVDRLAYGIVKQARGNPVIADERVLRTRWAKAAADAGLAFTPVFGKNEWEQVILAQDLRTEQAYLACPRTGRGRSLTRAQRSQVWQAAQQVTAELAAARESTHLQLASEATHLLRQAGEPRYRHILVDEAQDLHLAQWRLLRAAVAPGPDDLFIAADPHQRIYDSRVSLASLQISVRGQAAAVPELPDHPGDLGLGGAVARRRSGGRPGRRGRLAAWLPLSYTRPASAAGGGGHPGRRIRRAGRTDPLLAEYRRRAAGHRGDGPLGQLGSRGT